MEDKMLNLFGSDTAQQNLYGKRDDEMNVKEEQNR
jgi:hypothetical protein